MFRFVQHGELFSSIFTLITNHLIKSRYSHICKIVQIKPPTLVRHRFYVNINMTNEVTGYTIDKTAYTVVKEGKAEILFPNSNDVFYNPVQEFNRDLSVAVIKTFAENYFKNGKSTEKKVKKTNDETAEKSNQSEYSDDKEDELQLESGKYYDDGIKILEALAASGLRSVRYALEISGINSIVANDLVSQAVESIERNVKFNKVDHLVRANKDDAVMLMYNHRLNDRFHVVDIDPYGSPAHFLDAAVQCVIDGGILLVTCTDVAILCGNASETCFAKYGSVSLKNKCCHEMALRIILYSIQTHATRYGRYIVPLLSLSADFYVRVFVRIFTSPANAKHSASKASMVYQCTGCESISLQPLGKVTPHENGKNFKFGPSTAVAVNPTCSYCGFKHKVGGPIWNDSIHDSSFVQNVLACVEKSPDDFQTSKRIIGALNVMLEELPDAPLFYTLDGLFSVVRSCPPKLTIIRSAFLNAGYAVSNSHTCRNSVKTNAPNNVIWDIVRAWAKKNSIGKKAEGDNSPAKNILNREQSTDVSFDPHPRANPESREKKLVRYQHNPERFWGPKTRSKTSLLSGLENDKQKRLQGKRTQRHMNEGELKKFYCKRFKEGKCELGESCKYSHDENNCNLDPK